MNYSELQEEFNNNLQNILRSKREELLKLSSGNQQQLQFLRQQLINAELQKLRLEKIADLSRLTNRNVIVYHSCWLQSTNPNPDLSVNDNDMNGFMNAIKGLDKTKGLDLIIHTPGGSIVAAESIVLYLRKIFQNDIRVIVPHLAMSAGTMIACSSKQIIMGKQSSLGPIDPQYYNLSAEGIVEEFDRAITEVMANPNKSLVWREILSKYSPTMVGECKKAIELSVMLVTDWLKTGMFNKTKNKDQRVSLIMDEIASHANSKTHGRHFDFEFCKRIGLKVSKLEDSQDLQNKVMTIHHAMLLTAYNNLLMLKIIENSANQTFCLHGKR